MMFVSKKDVKSPGYAMLFILFPLVTQYKCKQNKKSIDFYNVIPHNSSLESLTILRPISFIHKPLQIKLYQ